MKWCRSSLTDRVAEVKIQPSGLLRHHLFEFIRHRQRRQRQGKVARGAFVPVAVPRLINLFQPFEPPAIQRGALEGGVQQRRAAERQLRHVVAQFQRIIQQQQRALDIVVRQQLAQVAAIAGLAKLSGGNPARFAPGGRRISAAAGYLLVRCGRQW